MAKIEEDEPADTGGWINTFADLMNLLLCFFVLLFSMSTVDAKKYEAVVKSLSESINIFDGGGESIGQGPFIDSGTDQIVAISQYFNEFSSSGDDPDSSEDQSQSQPGESASKKGENNDQGGMKSDDGQNKSDDDSSKDNSDQKDPNEQQGQNNQNPSDDTKDNTDPNSKNEGQQQGDNIDKATVDAVEAQKAKEQKEKNEEVYSDVMDEAKNKNIEDEITVSMDKKNQFVQITLNGALLFESGQATIKDSVRPLLSKVGDILKTYKKNQIRIIGHTDNVPITSGVYPNNMWLSTARATTVFEYMRKVKKIKPKHMETTGRGEFDPIASNDTAEGRAKNRRVEFRIYTNE